MREHDPILGVVPLKLSEILQTCSQVTRWYPIDGGIVSWTSSSPYGEKTVVKINHELRDSVVSRYLYFSGV